MINRILTSPRPGGMPQQGQIGGGAVMGTGMAGVASNAEGEGIMVYNDRTMYDEWEFIYDPQKQKQIPNPNAQGAGGTPAQQMGTQGNPGVGNTGTSPGFGPNPGSTGSSPGSSSFGGGNSFGTSNSFGSGNSFGTGSPTGAGSPTGGRGVQPPATPPLPGR